MELEAAALEVRPTPRTKRRLLAMGSSEGEGGAREEMGIGTRSSDPDGGEGERGEWGIEGRGLGFQSEGGGLNRPGGSGVGRSAGSLVGQSPGDGVFFFFFYTFSFYLNTFCFNSF